MTEAVEAIKQNKPSAGSDKAVWDDYNARLVALILNGTDEEKKDATEEIIAANAHMIGSHVGDLRFTMYDNCQFEDAYQIMVAVLVETLMVHQRWDALLFRKALFKARRVLHNGYRSGGINISYSQSRGGAQPMAVVPLESLVESSGVQPGPEEIAEKNAMKELVLAIFEDAELGGVLKPFEKAILYAHYYDGKTYKEIAEENGYVQNSLARKARRAIAKLRNIAERIDPEGREFLF